MLDSILSVHELEQKSEESEQKIVHSLLSQQIVLSGMQFTACVSKGCKEGNDLVLPPLLVTTPPTEVRWKGSCTDISIGSVNLAESAKKLCLVSSFPK